MTERHKIQIVLFSDPEEVANSDNTGHSDLYAEEEEPYHQIETVTVDLNKQQTTDALGVWETHTKVRNVTTKPDKFCKSSCLL